MLSAADPLPRRPRRILIAGVTGSGKTTLARRLADEWGLLHVEIDALFHGENWTPRTEFLDDVRALAAEDRWVTEWQYTSKGTDEILIPRAEMVIWLDYPYRTVRARLLRRTFVRSVLRTKMWNGNVEAPLWKGNWLSTDPEKNILAWQTRTLHKWTARMPTIEAAFPHLTIMRLHHPRETRHWLSRVSAGASADATVEKEAQRPDQ